VKKNMIEVGRLCYKIAGREAGKPCIIIDIIDDNYVLIDGLVRRKRCNINHLEFTPIIYKVAKKADTETVVDLLVKNKIISEAPKKKTAEEKAVKNEKPVKHKIIKNPEKKEAKKQAKAEKKTKKPKTAKPAKKAAKKPKTAKPAKKAAKKPKPAKKKGAGEKK